MKLNCFYFRDDESSFRCFVYKKNYSGFLVSMSGGAECNLYTATEGHTTFQIKKCRVSRVHSHLSS